MNKRNKLRELLSVLGIKDQISSKEIILNNLITQYFPNNPGKIKELGASALMEAIVEGAIEVFTEAEIDAILKFYKTPLGSSVNAKRILFATTIQHTIRGWMKKVCRKEKSKPLN